MGSIEKIDPDFKLPYDEDALLSGDPKRLTRYILELVRVLQDLIERIAVLTDLSIDLVDGAAVYYALKQSSDQDYPDGTWRRIQVGNNLEDQVKLSGTWTTVSKRERPVA